jgi:hypothetical protein
MHLPLEGVLYQVQTLTLIAAPDLSAADSWIETSLKMPGQPSRRLLSELTSVEKQAASGSLQ